MNTLVLVAMGYGQRVLLMFSVSNRQPFTSAPSSTTSYYRPRRHSEEKQRNESQQNTMSIGLNPCPLWQNQGLLVSSIVFYTFDATVGVSS